MLNRQQWAQILTDSYKQLEDMLAQRQCKLANTEGNKYRVVEAVQKSFGVEPENPTVQDIAARMFSFVLSDTNALVNGQPGGGQLYWETKPLKIQKYEEQKRGAGERPTHLPDKPKPRVAESPELRKTNIKAMEGIYTSMNFNPTSPRAPVVRDFINSISENKAFDSTEALIHLQTISQLGDWNAVANQLRLYLRNGGAQ